MDHLSESALAKRNDPRYLSSPMPELPEVETVARGLAPLTGKILNKLEVFDSKVWFESELTPRAFTGDSLQAVSRRGKYIIFRFHSGKVLLVHLRMTGKILPEDSSAIPPEARRLMKQKRGKGLQIRCRFHFAQDSILFFDTRRFGTVTAVKGEADFFTRKKIAPDPFHTEKQARENFGQKLQKNRRPIKAALLDQSVVAGVGNIYADEALFRSGIHPLTAAYRVRDQENLWQALLSVMRASLARGGTSVYNYLDAAGNAGKYAERLRVYGKTGTVCHKCRETKIQRIVVAGRSTHFCSQCQKKN